MLERVNREALLLHSASLVGLAEEAVRRTVEYVKVREQFGRQIGRFQAVKHMLADVYVANEVAWNAVLYAALRSEEDDLASSVSRVQAVEAALAASKAMVQLHGGFGFTWEAEAHYFLKMALAGANRFGGRDRRALGVGRKLVTA
jgi:alkylation response protein AidB-like acyl-CoA dehydrogenase